MSQKSLSLSEINTSTFRVYKFKPRANSKRSTKTELGNIRNRDLHFIYLNLNILQPKIGELREIVKVSVPTVTGITETKLDNSIGDSEVSIDRYCAIQPDWNRKGGGIICYVTNKICYNNKSCISKETENVLIELIIPKAKPITVGIVYKSPDQARFLEILSDSLNSLNMLSEE